MQDNLKQNFLKGRIEINKDLSKLNVFNNWINTNRMLEDYYKRPDVNIINDSRGLNIKNSMRHIVGSSKYQQNYGLLAKPFGYIKEGMDFFIDPFKYMTKNKSLNYPKYLLKTINDSSIDLENNKIGREFAKKNPDATDEDTMKYALQQALLNYDKQYNTNPSKKLQDMLLSK